MKVCSISDLHGTLIQYPSTYWNELWECEILFICGDILPLHIQFDMNKSLRWLMREFKPWAEELPVEKIYIVGGNHDSWFECNEKSAKNVFSPDSKITYLKNDWIDHVSMQDSQTYRIFGTPYCHIYGNWPFMRNGEILKEKFSEMPENVDILFCHDAPYGVSDICFQGWSADGQHKGNPQLRDAILEKKPRYCFHGHLHSSNHGEEILGTTKVYNTSILDEEYKITYDPLYIRITKDEEFTKNAEFTRNEGN